MSTGDRTNAQVVGEGSAARVELPVRVHRPGGGVVRFIVPAELAEGDVEAAAELVRQQAPATAQVLVEREPGSVPEGWRVWESWKGEGAESSAWSWGRIVQTDIESREAEGGATEQAEAIDGAWTSFVEENTERD